MIKINLRLKSTYNKEIEYNLSKNYNNINEEIVKINPLYEKLKFDEFENKFNLKDLYHKGNKKEKNYLKIHINGLFKDEIYENNNENKNIFKMKKNINIKPGNVDSEGDYYDHTKSSQQNKNTIDKKYEEFKQKENKWSGSSNNDDDDNNNNNNNNNNNKKNDDSDYKYWYEKLFLFISNWDKWKQMSINTQLHYDYLSRTFSSSLVIMIIIVLLIIYTRYIRNSHGVVNSYRQLGNPRTNLLSEIISSLVADLPASAQNLLLNIFSNSFSFNAHLIPNNLAILLRWIMPNTWMNRITSFYWFGVWFLYQNNYVVNMQNSIITRRIPTEQEYRDHHNGIALIHFRMNRNLLNNWDSHDAVSESFFTRQFDFLNTQRQRNNALRETIYNSNRIRSNRITLLFGFISRLWRRK